MVNIASGGSSLPVFLARPAGRGPYPGVLVVMEAFGLNDHIKKVVERIAAEGYVVAAPNLYFRAEGKQVAGYDELPRALALMAELWDEKVLEDMGATIAYLQKQPFTRAESIGVTGFCMGGRIAFLTACRNAAVKAAASFYGGGIASVMMPGEKTPKAPLEYASKLRAPMLLFFGENDPFIPLAEVDKIKKRLAELGRETEVKVYHGAQHGFFCEDRDSYDAEAAADSWDRLKKFFASNLKD